MSTFQYATATNNCKTWGNAPLVSPIKELTWASPAVCVASPGPPDTCGVWGLTGITRVSPAPFHEPLPEDTGFSQHMVSEDRGSLNGGWPPKEGVVLMASPRDVTSTSSYRSSKPLGSAPIPGLEQKTSPVLGRVAVRPEEGVCRQPRPRLRTSVHAGLAPGGHVKFTVSDAHQHASC